MRQLFHFDVVDVLVGVETVGNDVEPFAGHVERHAVRQVAAGGEIHSQHGVAGLEEGQEHRLVGLGTGVRLHVGTIGAEQFLGAIDGKLLDHVDVLAAAVVALARIALGILVGELRTLSFHYRP